MTNIEKEILQNRKVLSQPAYRKWLEEKLRQHHIDRSHLIATIIVVERTLSSELERSGSRRIRPFYKLFKDDGKPTRAWIYAAELVLWLKYNRFKANPYVRSIVSYPFVRSRIVHPSDKKQIPLNILFPVTRTNTSRLKAYSHHFRAWINKN